MPLGIGGGLPPLPRSAPRPLATTHREPLHRQAGPLQRVCDDQVCTRGATLGVRGEEQLGPDRFATRVAGGGSQPLPARSQPLTIEEGRVLLPDLVLLIHQPA